MNRRPHRGARHLRTITLTAAALASAMIAPAVPSQTPRTAAQNVSTKGASHMSALKISLSLQSSAPVYTESMPATITLLNGGTAAAQIPDPDAPSVFEFLVKPLDSSQPGVTLSALAARFARDPDPTPRLPSERTELAPGATHAYAEDIAQYAAQPLPPGHYTVTAVYRAGATVAQSAAVPFEISPPRIAGYAAVASAQSDGLASVFAHLGANGRIAILQNDSRPGRPQDVVSYRRLELPPGATVEAVAVSVEALPEDEETSGRWYAYLQAGRLGAGMADGATTFLHIEPADLGLQQAQLQSVGWQPDPNRAVFVAVGAAAAGKPAMAIVTFLARERRALVRVAPLSGTVVPARWAARYRAGGAGVIDLIASEPSQAGTRLYWQSFTVDGGQAAKAGALIQRPEPLAALALPPVAAADADADAVDILFGPAGTPAKMTFIREPVAGGAALMDVSFVVPTDDQQHPPGDWVLAPDLPEHPVAAARFRGQIIGRTLGHDGKGLVLEPQAPDASRLQLQVLDQSIWASWVNGQRGFEFRRLP